MLPVCGAGYGESISRRRVMRCAARRIVVPGTGGVPAGRIGPGTALLQRRHRRDKCDTDAVRVGAASPPRAGKARRIVVPGTGLRAPYPNPDSGKFLFLV